MIGYVQADEPPDVIVAVNTAIDAHVEMGSMHRLRSQGSPEGPLHRYESKHVRVQRADLSLRHYLVDLRTEDEALT